MGWQDNLQPAAYNDPVGGRYTFEFEDLSRSVTLLGSAFDAAGGQKTYVQRLGRTGFRLPLRCFFSGENNDKSADEFLASLLIEGVGRLEHPRYGTLNVVPLGDVKQRDDLVTKAGQSVIEVTFFETGLLVFPSSQADIASQIGEGVSSYNAASAEKFNDELKIANESEKISFKSVYTAALNGVQGALDSVTKAQKSVNDQVNNVYNSINDAIDVLIAQPATLAFQTNILLQTPALMEQSLSARIDGYKNLITSLISGGNAVVQPSNDNVPLNTFQTSDLYASGSLTAYIDNVVNGQFETKGEALLVAEDIIAQFNELSAWREANYASLGLLDTSDQYQGLQELVALCAGFLVQLSFSLKQERRIVLGRNRTMIDLVAELYGEVDSVLDFFIDTNNLSGDEYLEILKGREIVYFV